MMPQTVPNRPMNGAVEPTEARKTIQRSSRSISRCDGDGHRPVDAVPHAAAADMSAPATRALRCHSPIAAPNTAAIGWRGLRPSRRTARPGCRRTRSGPRTCRPRGWPGAGCDHSRTRSPRPRRWRPAAPSITSLTTMSACMNRPQQRQIARRAARQIHRIDCPIHSLNSLHAASRATGRRASAAGIQRRHDAPGRARPATQRELTPPPRPAAELGRVILPRRSRQQPAAARRWPRRMRRCVRYRPTAVVQPRRGAIIQFDAPHHEDQAMTA